MLTKCEQNMYVIDVATLKINDALKLNAQFTNGRDRNMSQLI